MMEEEQHVNSIIQDKIDIVEKSLEKLKTDNDSLKTRLTLLENKTSISDAVIVIFKKIISSWSIITMIFYILVIKSYFFTTGFNLKQTFIFVSNITIFSISILSIISSFFLIITHETQNNHKNENTALRNIAQNHQLKLLLLISGLLTIAYISHLINN